MFDLNTEISQWRTFLSDREHLSADEIDELEDHLRNQVDDLTETGLKVDEAFLVAIKRLGNISSVSREYAKVNSRNLWKQLLTEDEEQGKSAFFEIALIVLLSIMAGTVARIPGLFGVDLNFMDGPDMIWVRNISFYLFPLLSFYFIWKQGVSRRKLLITAAVYVAAGILINVYPWHGARHTEQLTAIHLPIFFWLFLAAVYGGDDWFAPEKKMNFIRFTGEMFIYIVLILCGGLVLIMLASIVFGSIGMTIDVFLGNYLSIYGFLAAPIVAAYLVEAKKSIIENLAPVLSRIFSPLFLVLLVAFLISMAFLGKSPFMDRDLLIGFDLLLVLILGMVLYTISSRKQDAGTMIFDYINFFLILAALVIDVIALAAIIFRMSSFGMSINKAAALGLNVILLGNLTGLAVSYLLFFFRKIRFQTLEKWQTVYLIVFFLWAGIVAFIFPLLYQFT